MIETHKKDLSQLRQRISPELFISGDGTAVDATALCAFLRNEMLPMFESMLDELGEIDEAVAELAEDETGTIDADFADVVKLLVTSGMPLVEELARRSAGDQNLTAGCAAWCKLASETLATLEEPPDDGDDEQEPEVK